MTKISFLLQRGSPPRMNPILLEAFERLERAGIEVETLFPEEQLLRLDRLPVTADLYVLKSNTRLALSLALALESRGAHVVNTVAASLRAKDKVVAAAVLQQAGVPTPRSLVTAGPAQLAETVSSSPLILKPHRGCYGKGVRVVECAADLPTSSAYPDLVFAQEYLAHARTDLKVFVIGERAFGVRKTFGHESYLTTGVPVTLSPAVEELVDRCQRAFGLELFGVEIAEEAEDLSVIDVNYFPGYRGVPDAAQHLSEHLLAAARAAA